MEKGRLASSFAGTIGSGVAPHLANRVRSASPSRRALAIDMRRVASLLRDAPVGAYGDCSVNTSGCSSPQSAWEPGDRGAAPIGASGATTRAAFHSQINALSEKVSSAIADLQRKFDADRRRLVQVERKLDTRLEERARESDGREKWAEVHGSVHGLLDEMQNINRRVEELDQRLCTRTSASETAKQRNKELEQQVQALEKSCLASVAVEETQKRHSTKIRRTEQSLEELARRIAKAEEDLRSRPSHSSTQAHVEQRLTAIGHLQEQMNIDIHNLQAQIDDGLQAISDNQLSDGGCADAAAQGALEEAVQVAERGLSSLEKKLSAQIEDLASSSASLRVKMDGQYSRVASISERLEVAHEPAIESIRAELAQARAQDRRELEGELAVLRARVATFVDGSEDPQSEIRQALRQAQADITALSTRLDESPLLRSFDERLSAHEQHVMDLRAELGDLPLRDDPLNIEEQLPDEWEDLKHRIEWLEEQATKGADADQVERQQVAQVQSSFYEVLEQVSIIKQKQSSNEASNSGLHQQIQALQTVMETRSKDDPSTVRLVTEVEAKVAAVSQQVIHLEARLLEVEGGLEFARENETLPGVEVSAVSMVSEMVSNPRPPPPLPKASEAIAAEQAQPHTSLLEQLEAVACHLEVLDDLAERVTTLELRGGTGLGEGMAFEDQVSFGPPASCVDPPGALTAEVESTAQQVNEAHGRLKVVEQSLEVLERKTNDLAADSIATRTEKIETELGKVMVDVSAKLNSLSLDRDRLQSLEEGRMDTLARLEQVEVSSSKVKQIEVAEVGVAMKDVHELSRKLDGISECVDSEKAQRGAFEDAINETLMRHKQAVEHDIDSMKGNWTTLQQASNDVKDVESVNEFAGLGQRVKMLEEHLASTSCSQSVPTVSSTIADDTARARFQTMVEDLRAKVVEELGSLTEHQAELANAKASLRDSSQKALGGDSAVASDVAATLSELRSDIQQLREGRVGTDAFATQPQVSELRIQLAELQERFQGTRGNSIPSVRKIGISSATSEDVASSPTALQIKLNAISEQVADLQSQLSKRGPNKLASDSLRDASLNLSLTEDASVDNLAGGSLNFSLTEQSGDVHDIIPSEKPRPPALNIDGDQSGTGGYLPRVMEEEEVPGELTVEEMVPQSSRSPHTGISGHARGVGASVTPKSSKSSADSPSGAGEVSHSGNELSMGYDVSVEDSLQLEDECDHIETVEPFPKAASSCNPLKSSEPLEPPMGKALPVAGKVGLFATDATQVKQSTDESPSKDDDKYGDESFDDVSVAESIAESIEQSASWANDEDAS